jgi:5-methylcytosine-specific restriction endonuclease McrA
MGKILDYLNEQETILGIKEVREDCRKYMLKKTYSGYEKVKRKPIPKSWIIDAWGKQGGICPRCKQNIEHNEMSGDHITPLALGGKHSKWNIQCLHKKCNSSKNANDFVKESKLQQTGQTLHVNDEKYTRVPIENEV